MALHINSTAAVIALLGGFAAIAHLAHASDDDEPQQTDRLKNWPLVGVIQFSGYENVELVRPSPPVTLEDKTGAAVSRRKLDEKKRMAQWQRLWPNVRLQLQRAVRILRPELDILVDKMVPGPDSQMDILSAVIGDVADPPYMFARCDVSNNYFRLAELRIFAPAKGDEAAVSDRRRWTAYGQETMGRALGLWPEGKLHTRRVSNGLYLDWKPFWRDIPLPSPYWTRFAALKHGDHWMLAWTVLETPIAVRQAVDRLREYPFRQNLHSATMLVVKNSLALLPDLVDQESRVTSRCETLLAGHYGVGSAKVVYHNEAAMARQRTHKDPVACWHVEISPAGERLTKVTGWVDPANGKLLILAVSRPPD